VEFGIVSKCGSYYNEQSWQQLRLFLSSLTMWRLSYPKKKKKKKEFFNLFFVASANGYFDDVFCSFADAMLLA